ncbi:ParB/RepB/Spo0J family partition protein [Nocardia terpenica]|uniref:Transcriptional regulator n=2 Tax=Nocardia terpenica TaxID=455432 RepID=A0A291RQG6_9NOCA|nr:ParB/RepB/Spo0J family partition protein [Nocardia terpenica]ATL69786.1 transcriptional regulator [Nocardia terpenica]
MASSYGLAGKSSTSAAEPLHRLPFCSNVVELSISDVLPSDSPPRTEGVSASHIRMLAESLTAFPPIVVYRDTMQVVDGWHRLHAARLRGDTTIAAVFFDGGPAEAFVLAVKLNSTHGLPLSLADRKAAAFRILLSYPDWSNRRVAEVVGLSDKTIAAVRRGAGAEIPHRADERVGRDGVAYPIRAGEGRRRALDFLDAHPEASAKEVALGSGTSLTTAKKVRREVRAGRALAAAEEGPGIRRSPAPAEQPSDHGGSRDPGTIVRILRADPSLRFTEHGRKLLRMLDSVPADPRLWESMAESLPGHCAILVGELARQYSLGWQHLAETLARRAGSDRIPGHFPR